MKNRLLTTVSIATFLLLAEGLWVYAFLPRPADASRNAAGTYSLPAGNPVVTGTSISSTWANNTLSDLATELSDSKSRSGKGDFTAPVRGADGTVASPTWSWTNDTGSGWYRIGASDFGLAMAGVKVGEWTVNGYRSANGAVATPSLSFFNDTGSGLYRAASLDLRFAVNGADVTKWTASRFSVSPNSSGATPNSGSKVVIEDNTTNFLSLLAPNANSSAIIFGDVASGSRGQIQYYNSAHGSADQMQFGTNGTIRAVISNNGLGVGGSNQFTVDTSGRLSSGVTIGTGGTAIANSIRGTTTWNPGTVAHSTVVSTTISMTGVAAGADCVAGVLDPAPISGYTVQCITTANTCTIGIVNQDSVSKVFASATFYCRTFAP